MRECGPCTLCCELVPVAEIGKRGFAKCDHQRDAPCATVGCAIYDTRPTSCRLWSCAWFDGRPGFDDDLRPDRCGVVFDPMPDVITVNGRRMACAQAWVRPGTEFDALSTGRVMAVVRRVVASGRAVLFRLSGETAIIAFGMDGRVVFTEPTGPSDGREPADRLREAIRLGAIHD